MSFGMQDVPSRIKIGIWTELEPSASWAHEGMVRLLGFLIEGAAENHAVSFHIVVLPQLKDAVEQDLRTLNAEEGLDWLVHAPPEGWEPEPLSLSADQLAAADSGEPVVQAAQPCFPRGEVPPAWNYRSEAPKARFEWEHQRWFSGLAKFARTNVNVDGWLALFPFYEHALDLGRRALAYFPDAIPFDFPLVGLGAWGPVGSWTRWVEKTRRTLARCDGLVTVSRHVSEQVAGLYGFPREKIHTVQHAPPDLLHLISGAKDRKGGPQTRRLAADLLRAHARERCWSYLADFPFEEVPYIVVSTQDRVTKNIGTVAEAVRRLIRRDRINIKLLTTAALHFDSEWTLLPNIVERHQLHYDVLSLHRLPREVHAALYHCAALVVHPSFFEGGETSFPFSEGVSVGTPCLQAHSPYFAALSATLPEIAEFSFDPYDVEELTGKIRQMLVDREKCLDVQLAAYEKSRQRSWARASFELAMAVAGFGAPDAVPRTWWSSGPEPGLH